MFWHFIKQVQLFSRSCIENISRYSRCTRGHLTWATNWTKKKGNVNVIWGWCVPQWPSTECYPSSSDSWSDCLHRTSSSPPPDPSPHSPHCSSCATHTATHTDDHTHTFLPQLLWINTVDMVTWQSHCKLTFFFVLQSRCVCWTFSKSNNTSFDLEIDQTICMILLAANHCKTSSIATCD